MGSAKTILFVDDDPLLLDVLPEMLPSAEFHSVVAADADDALSILADMHVDLLLTDLMMPGLDGLEFAMTVQHRYPTMPVVLMTGSVGRAYQAQGAGPVLLKPVRSVDIEATVRKVLSMGRLN